MTDVMDKVTNPCPGCGDTTDHKLPEALCRCTALLKGWEWCFEDGGRDEPGLEFYWYHPSRHAKDSRPPDYITDSALGMEMLEKLLKANWYLNFNDEWNMYVLTYDGLRVDHSDWDFFREEELEHVILRAAHAMMLAEWVEWVEKQPKEEKS